MIAIAAVSKNFVMGNSSDPKNLPFGKQKDDLQFFKEKTIGKNLLIGPKTFSTISHLKERNFYIVANHDKDIPSNGWLNNSKVLGIVDSTLFTNDDHPAIEMFQAEKFIVAGGAWLYHKTIPHCSELYLTIFDFDVDLEENNLYFPFLSYELNQLFRNKIEVRRLENGTIYHYMK